MDTYYQHSRPELHPLIPTDAMHILDIGCAAGTLGRAIKDRQECHVIGIEMVPKAAEAAREWLDEVFIGDAIALMSTMEAETLDCIVLADVLEHMEQPQRCLEEARRLLKAGGRIVASIPNVRHWSVLKDLLEGRWDYQDAGILDRTHLRFFTRESLIRMVQEAGFEFNSFSGVLVGDCAVPPGLAQSLAAFGLNTSSLDAEGRIYQYLLAASPAQAASNRPVVSVILPTHNRPAMLREALASLQRQTHRDFEVVIINDGETPVETVLAEFPELAIQSLRTPSPSQGPAASRNLGIKSAKGRYIAFLDDDDCYYPEHLDRLVTHAEASGAMIAYANSHEASEKLIDGRWQVVQRNVRYAQDFDRDRFLLTNYIPILNVLVRREALDACGLFDESLRTLEDWDLWIRLSRRFDFLHVNEVTAEYRVRPEDRLTSTHQFFPVQRALYEKYASCAQDKPAIRVLQQTHVRKVEATLAGKVFDLGIALVVRDQAEVMVDCLTRLVEAIPDELSCQLLIVDDGSKDGTLDLLAELEGDVLVLHNPQPIGESRSLNEAIATLRAPLVLAIDPTTHLKAELLRTFVSTLQTQENVAAVGPVPMAFEGRSETIPALDLDCFMVRQADFIDVDGFDEKYAEGWQDDDLACKLLATGRQVLSLEGPCVRNREKAAARRDNSGDRGRFFAKWVPGPDDAPLSASPTTEPPLFSLVALTYNQLDYTKRFVDSVFSHSTAPFELILVDNGSKDGTPDYLAALAGRHPNVHVVCNDTNQGFAGGCNQGIAIARGEIVMLINNDTIVTERWLERFWRVLMSDPSVGMVGPRSNCVVGPQLVSTVPYDEEDIPTIQAYAERHAIRNRREGFYASRAIGFCVAIRRSVLEILGGLDTTFGMGNLEDDDLSLRTQMAGYRIWIANDCFIHHYGSKTFKAEKVDYRGLMLRNWEIFKAKWGLPSDLPLERGYSAKDILAQPLDASRLVFPILCPQTPPRPFEGARETNFLVLPDWTRDGLEMGKILRTYAEAFGAQDDVALVFWHDPFDSTDVETAGAQLQAILETEGLDPETMPDLILHSENPGPLQRAGFYRAAKAYLALESRRGDEEATACGVPCLHDPSVNDLRAIARVSASR